MLSECFNVLYVMVTESLIMNLRLEQGAVGEESTDNMYIGQTNVAERKSMGDIIPGNSM